MTAQWGDLLYADAQIAISAARGTKQLDDPALTHDDAEPGGLPGMPTPKKPLPPTHAFNPNYVLAGSSDGGQFAPGDGGGGEGAEPSNDDVTKNQTPAEEIPSDSAKDQGNGESKLTPSQEREKRNQAAAFDPQAAGDFLDQHKIEPSNPNETATGQGQCLPAIRDGVKAGGIDTTDMHGDPKNMGSWFERNGWKVSFDGTKSAESGNNIGFEPKNGDIAILDVPPNATGDQHGHISMFHNGYWYSDFKQRDMWSGPKYRTLGQAFKIYRRG